MKGIVFASFGTTHSAARKKHIDAVAQAMETAFSDCLITQAYTSAMVRRILAKNNRVVKSVSEALHFLAEAGVTDVVVQPGHLLPGEEYEKMCHNAEECRSLFASMRFGTPLLYSTEDLKKIGTILSEQYPFQANTAVVLMGHGTSQFANMAYRALDYQFKEMGRADVYVGTVEAYPDLAAVMRLMAGKGYAKVTVGPLMLVAGDHALNDMAGDGENSWASQLKNAGYEVECSLVGLGEIPGVQNLYLEHVQRAYEEE